MRGLEVVLLLLLLIGIGGWWGSQRPSAWLFRLCLTAVPVVLVHIFVEGYRWQMVPAYGLTAVLLLLVGRDWRKGQTIAPKKRLGGGIMLGGVWLIAAVLPFILPVPVIPAPTGAYAIGTTSYHLTDPTRDEFYSNKIGDKREIMVQIWYPAEDVAERPSARYLPDAATMLPALAERLNLPAFLLNHVNLVKTDAYVDPLVADGRFPVILFSHGLRGLRQQNTVLMQELASHGYIVVATDHTYGNLMTIFPDGRVIFYNPAVLSDEPTTPPRNGNTLMKVWAADASFVLDRLTAWDEEAGGMWNGRFDLDRVGMMGHSTGGGATLVFCQTDPRCQAGLGLDAWVEPVADEILAEGLQRPFLFQMADKWLYDAPVSNVQLTRDIYHSLDDGYLITFNGAAHFDFTDIPLLSPLTPYLGLSSNLPSEKLIGQINAYTLAFFNETLRAQSAPLLHQEPVDPYVDLERAR